VPEPSPPQQLSQPQQPAQPAQAAQPTQAAQAQESDRPQQGQGFTITDLRRLWPDVLEEVKNRRRFTWILLSQNANVADLTNGTLVLAMPNVGARDSFSRGGSEDVLREALISVIGADLKIETMVDPSAGGPGAARGGGRSGPPAPGSGRAEPAADTAAGGWGGDVPAGTPTAPEPVASPGDSTTRPNPPMREDPSQIPSEGPATPGEPASSRTSTGPADPPPWAVDERSQATSAPSWAAAPPRTDEWDVRDAAAHRDDDVVDEGGVTHTELLQQRLGAEIIAEEESGA